MRSLIVMGCVLCWLGADTDAVMLDVDLYRRVLDPELCADQWENVDRYQFYDASFRVPQGMVYGHFKDYGNFYECLAIDQNYHGKSVQGKYCVISAHLSPPIFRIPSLWGASDSSNLTWTEVKLNRSTNDTLLLDANVTEPLGSWAAPASATLQLAVCVPRACAPDALLRRYADHPLLRFNYSLDFCRLPDDKPYAAADYVALFIFLLLGLLTVSSTTYELYHMFILKKEWWSADERLCAFSLHRNARLVLAPAAPPAPPAQTASPVPPAPTSPAAPGALHCLHGIRALSVLWIIIFHSTRLLPNSSINKEAISNKKYLWITTGHLAVDSFFVLSGLLLVYTTACKPKSLELRSLPLFWLNRYMRLFPLLALTVLLQASLVPRIVDGPTFTHYTPRVEWCRDYWWSALLHVQNIVNSKQMCAGHTWYLSVDTQLYVLASLMLCAVRRVRSVRATWLVLAAVTLAALTVTFAICFYFDFPDLARYTSIRPTDVYVRMYYFNTLTRSPPFFIGILVGYGLHVYRNEKLHLPKWGIFLGYSAALVLSSLAFFSYHPSTSTLWENQTALNSCYSLKRSCWALALGWLILACTHGYGGPVNWFLSLQLWQLVSRLSYAMYLLSYTIQVAATLRGDTNSIYFDMQSLLWTFTGDLGVTLALSVAASIVFEAPLLTLYRLLLKPRPKEDSQLKNNFTLCVNRRSQCKPENRT